MRNTARYIILAPARLAEPSAPGWRFAGRGVVLVARGDHLAAILEHGLRLRTPDEDLTQQLAAIGGPEEIQLDVDDILILTTKTHQANEMLVRWTDSRCTRMASPSGRWANACHLRCAQWRGRRGLCTSVLPSGVWGVRLMPVVHLQPGEVMHSQHADVGNVARRARAKGAKRS